MIGIRTLKNGNGGSDNENGYDLSIVFGLLPGDRRHRSRQAEGGRKKNISACRGKPYLPEIEGRTRYRVFLQTIKEAACKG